MVIGISGNLNLEKKPSRREFMKKGNIGATKKSKLREKLEEQREGYYGIKKNTPEPPKLGVKNIYDTSAGVLKIPDSPPQELSPKEAEAAINIIFINCIWDPEKVLENKEKILELIPKVEFKNKEDAIAKKNTGRA